MRGTSNKRLIRVLLYGNPDHDAHTGIFKDFFYRCGIRVTTNFADNSRSRQRIFLRIFLAVGHVTDNKSFDFGADSDHDSEFGSENFERIFFRGSAALLG